MTAEPRTSPERRAALRRRYTPEPVPTCAYCHRGPMVRIPPQPVDSARYVHWGCPHDNYGTVTSAGEPEIIALIDDADDLAGALAEVVRQREIIRQARRHVQVILKQTDAGLMEMRAALGNAIGPGEGPLRGVRGNLLALFDDLDRAALAPHDAADLLRKLAAMAPNRPLGARGAGATATDTSGTNTGALGA